MAKNEFEFDDLKTAFLEMVDVLQLTEKKNGKKVPLSVPEDADSEYLETKIKEVAEMIDPKQDEFTDETQKVIDALTKEEEPEEEVKPVRGKSPKTSAKEEKTEKEDKPKGKKPEKAGEPGKPGIIQTIVNAIEKSGKKGVTKEELLETLKEEFPDRNEQSMKNTINVQVPARINKEKFPLKKLEGGRYAKA